MRCLPRLPVGPAMCCVGHSAGDCEMAQKRAKKRREGAEVVSGGKGEIVIYQPARGGGRLEVRLEEETLWLSLTQIAGLFGRDKSVISRHLRNVLRDGELDRQSVVVFFATTAADGKTYGNLGTAYSIRSCTRNAIPPLRLMSSCRLSVDEPCRSGYRALRRRRPVTAVVPSRTSAAAPGAGTVAGTPVPCKGKNAYMPGGSIESLLKTCR